MVFFMEGVVDCQKRLKIVKMGRSSPQPAKNLTGLPTRVIVVPLIRDEAGRCLLCRKPAGRGVFPGRWGLPGGGIEPGETLESALRREIREEVGLEIAQIEPLFFKDGVFPKLYPDGRREEIYMIFLVFACQSLGQEVRLNEELEAYDWVEPDALHGYDLNDTTRDTLRQAGLLSG
jgi:nucleoside triphosphatase